MTGLTDTAVEYSASTIGRVVRGRSDPGQTICRKPDFLVILLNLIWINEDIVRCDIKELSTGGNDPRQRSPQVMGEEAKRRGHYPGRWEGEDRRVFMQSCSTCSVVPCQLQQSLLNGSESIGDLQRNVVRLRRGETMKGRLNGTDDYWNVIQGAVMVQSLLPDGRRQVAYFGFPGETLSTRLDPRFGAFGLQAVCETLLCQVEASAISGLSANGSFAEQMLSQSYARIAHAGVHSIVLGRMTAGERIATFLCEVILRSGAEISDDTALLLPMSREDIADYLGLNSETVSRIFTRLKKAKILELPRSDRARLKNAHALIEMVPFESIEDIFGLAPLPARERKIAAERQERDELLGSISLVGAQP